MSTAKKTKAFKSGVVSVVGRPNVGKSTLVNAILKEKVAIVSSVPQTTRFQIRGIYTDARGQIIFIDTPGLHRSKDKLDKAMNTTSLDSIQNADCIVHLADTSRPCGREEEMIIDNLKDLKTPIIIGLNKIDLKGKYVTEYISLWEKIKGKSIHDIKNIILLPLSGTEDVNIDKLLDLIFERLEVGELLYPADTLTDLPQRLAIADIIREKLFSLMREEIPYSLAVVVEEMEKHKRGVLYIRAKILVERPTQKEIVIGKHGNILKEVGTLARKELEELLESKVFLETFVGVEKKWRDDDQMLKELGYGS